MTKQETFKARVRSRMEKTGERYNAARRVLIEQARGRRSSNRKWVSAPEMSEESVRANTGRGWDEWTDLLDSWSANTKGHTAIATYLREEQGVDGWWAQSVTLGYERIKGLRLRYQGADGTFTANKSKTVKVDARALRSMLLDDGDRNDLFGGLETELRSRPDAKSVRIGMGSGTAQVFLEPLADGRTKVTVMHEKLESSEDVELWKKYWSEWLAAIDVS